jgi:hypothetical protein
MAIPRIPSRMEEIDPPYRPYIRAMHPNLAMIKPNIIRAIPPMILRRVLISKSNIGMVEGQLVHILLRQALIDGQGFKTRLFTRQRGVPWGHWCYLSLATKVFARRKIQLPLNFLPLFLRKTNEYYWESPHYRDNPS